MFRAERRAKRVAKIKSRTFRKIAKRSAARRSEADGEGALTMEEMEDLDALDGGIRAEVERERLETLRARERATLRHASGKSGATAGGRWSRSLGGLNGMDDDMKDAVRARESKNELLRRKISGRDSASRSGSDDDVEEGVSDHDEEEDDALTSRTAKELAALRSTAASGESKELPKGLMGMKFMQRAMQREDDKIDRAIDDFDAQIGNGPDEAEGIRGGDLVQNNPGRMVLAPSAQAGTNGTGTSQQKSKKSSGSPAKTNGNVSVAAPAGASNASTATLIDYNPFSGLSTSANPTAAQSIASAEEETNPWLALSTAGGSSSKISRKLNEQIGGKDGKSADRAAAKVQKEQGKSKEALKRQQEEARVDIDLDKVLLAVVPVEEAEAKEAVPVTSPSEEKKRKNRENAPPPSSAAASGRQMNGSTPARGGDDEDAESGSDNDSDALPESVKRSQNASGFKQRDLVAQAFAGDNVVADFEAMKAVEIAADAPKEEDLTLPGWGAWGGKGARKTSAAAKKKHVKHIPGIEQDKRKDAKLAHVVISERTDKKAKKYLTKDLPYPYTSVKQYEQRLAMPTGAEWNTRGSSREMTMPRVLTKPGAVIKPISRQV